MEDQNVNTATGGQEGAGQDGTGATGGTTETLDYKALYEAAKAEGDSLHQKNNSLSREAAELRKEKKDKEAKEREQLSQEEQYKLALADKEKEVNDLQSVINKQEILSLFTSKGVDKDIYTPIVDKLTADIEEGKLFEFRKSLAEAVLTAIDSVSKKVEALAKNGSVVNGTVKTGGQDGGAVQSQFKQFQETMNKNKNTGRVEL